MRNQPKTEKSRSRLSYIEMGSDKDVLMHNAQGSPRIEITVHGERNPHETPGGSLAIYKTVDVETSVMRREQ
jgi:hypothetical protein